MLCIRDIDHLVLRVSNIDTMIAFYGDVLGCPVHRRDDGIQLVQLRAGRALIDLIPVDSAMGRASGGPPSAEGRNLDHFCLRVEPWDADAICAHLRSHGVEPGPVAQRFGAEGRGPSIYLKDPEGNTVELKGPPDANPQP